MASRARLSSKLVAESRAASKLFALKSRAPGSEVWQVAAALFGDRRDRLSAGVVWADGTCNERGAVKNSLPKHVALSLL